MLGYSGEKLAFVWLSDGARILYACGATLVVQHIESGAQTVLIGHTADVVALSAAEETPLVASA